MVKDKNKMVKKYPKKYSPFRWGRTFPEFEISRDFLKNGVWEPRDEDEDLLTWSKFILYVETPVDTEYLFKGSLEHMQKTGEIQKLFGATPGSLTIQGWKARPQRKKEISVEAERHSTVMQSLGKDTLESLLDPDREMELELLTDDVGERKNVTRSVRGIMGSWKKDGLRVAQCIAPNQNGGWDAYYANGIGCKGFKEAAMNWSSSPAAHFKFHCLGRGVTQASASAMIRKCFSQSAISDAASAKMVDGKVMTARKASTRAILAKMEGPKSFIDITKGMPRKKILAYLEEQHHKEEVANGKKDTDKNPGDEDAYNFGDDNTFAQHRSNSSMVYTAEKGASMGGTTFNPPDEEGEDDESKEDNFWQNLDSDDAMEADNDGEFQFENIGQVDEDQQAMSTTNKEEDDVVMDEVEAGDGISAEEGGTEDAQRSLATGNRNSSGGAESVTGRDTSTPKPTWRTLHRSDEHKAPASAPQYNEEDDQLLVVNALLKMDSGGKTVSKEEYMETQSGNTNNKKNNGGENNHGGAGQQVPSVPANGKVAATEAAGSNEDLIQQLMAKVAQLTAQLQQVQALSNVRQSDEDTLGQRQTNPPRVNSQSAAINSAHGNHHDGQEGEAGKAGSDQLPD